MGYAYFFTALNIYIQVLASSSSDKNWKKQTEGKQFIGVMRTDTRGQRLSRPAWLLDTFLTWKDNWGQDFEHQKSKLCLPSCPMDVRCAIPN